MGNSYSRPVQKLTCWYCATGTSYLMKNKVHLLRVDNALLLNLTSVYPKGEGFLLCNLLHLKN